MLKLICSDCMCEFGSGSFQPALSSTDWQSIISYLERLKIFKVIFPFFIAVISAALRQKREAYEVWQNIRSMWRSLSVKEQSIYNMQKNLLFISIASHMSPCREMYSSTDRNKPLSFIYLYIALKVAVNSFLSLFSSAASLNHMLLISQAIQATESKMNFLFH